MADTYLDSKRGDLASVALDQALERGADPTRVLLLRADALLAQERFFELIQLSLPEDLSVLAKIRVLHRQAEAVRILNTRNLMPDDGVANTYLELWRLVHENSAAPELSTIVESLQETRRSDANVERGWQHFNCRLTDVAPTYWQPPKGSESNVMHVGPTRPVKTPADAARIATDGAVIEIDSATYRGGVALWPQNNLTIRGIGERPIVSADGKRVEERDVWLFVGDQVTVENVEISGARSRDENGAGIRHIGESITLRHVYLHDNENGILTGNAQPASQILIEHSEFANNGDGKGYAHNIYIGRSARFEMRYSYSHDSRGGHLLKSRARQNVISYNRLSDDEDGASSYNIDLPEGGVAEIVGNVVQQGYRTLNHGMITFGAEELQDDKNRLIVASNTLYNRDLGGVGIRNHKSLDILFINNVVAGAPLTPVEGVADIVANATLTHAELSDPAAYDFTLKGGIRAIDDGSDAGPTPVAEYVHPLGWRVRKTVGKLDPGAYERCGL